MAAQAGEIKGLLIEVGQQIVDQMLEIGDIAPQALGEQGDAVGHLGQDQGEQQGDGQNQGQIGGGDRQGPAEAVRRFFGQDPLVEPVEKQAGAGEDEGNGEAQIKGPHGRKRLAQEAPQHVEFQQGQHQEYRIGDNKQDRFQQIFVHGSSLVFWR